MTEKRADLTQVRGRPAAAPTSIYRIEARPAGDGRKADRAARKTQTTKASLASEGLGALQGEAVYLVFDAEELARMQQRAAGVAMVDEISHDLFGNPTITKIPADVASTLLREPGKSFGKSVTQTLGSAFGSGYRLPSLAAVVGFALQSHALWKSMDDIKNVRGLQRYEAMSGVMSAALGILGASVELASIGLSARAASRASAPAAALAGRISWQVRMRIAGGFLAGGAAVFDGIGALLKTLTLLNKGDRDAASFAGIQAGLQLVGGGAVLAGGGLNWSVAKRMAVQVGARATAAVALGGVAATLSGVGLALWILGFGASLISTALKDDKYEIWLDRSFFGRHKRSEGKFENETGEINSFNSLANDVSVEWSSSWFDSKEFSVKIAAPFPDKDSKAVYSLDGYSDKGGQGKITENIRSDRLNYVGGPDSSSWEIKIEAVAKNALTRVARLSFEIKGASGVVAKDSIWIEN